MPEVRPANGENRAFQGAAPEALSALQGQGGTHDRAYFDAVQGLRLVRNGLCARGRGGRRRQGGEARLQKGGRDTGGEIQLTDALRTLAQNKGLWAYIYEGISYDAGDKLGFLKATVEFGMANSEFGKEFRDYLKELKL